MFLHASKHPPTLIPQVYRQYHHLAPKRLVCLIYFQAHKNKTNKQVFWVPKSCYSELYIIAQLASSNSPFPIYVWLYFHALLCLAIPFVLSVLQLPSNNTSKLKTHRHLLSPSSAIFFAQHATRIVAPIHGYSCQRRFR